MTKIRDPFFVVFLSPKLLDKIPWNSLWYLILSYMIDWHLVHLNKYKDKENIFYVNGGDLTSKNPLNPVAKKYQNRPKLPLIPVFFIQPVDVSNGNGSKTTWSGWIRVRNPKSKSPILAYLVNNSCERPVAKCWCCQNLILLFLCFWKALNYHKII